MKNFLKVAICFIVLFSFSEAKAQISLGAGTWFGTDIENVGFSVNGKYEISEKWAAAPSYTYFLKKHLLNWSVVDLDANYQITSVGEKGSLYGIGGLNLTFWKLEYSGHIITDLEVKSTEYNVNLGVGLNFDLSDKFAIAPEAKYTVGGINYFRIGGKFLFGL